MYRVTARQILLIAFAAAVMAAVTVLGVQQLSGHWQPFGSASSVATPANITDPSLATDEQNNIEVYKATSPGVVFITSTSYQRGFFGEVEEGKEGGSGSIIDDQGDILTNYHVIEGSQKLTVGFGGDKTYPAK